MHSCVFILPHEFTIPFMYLSSTAACPGFKSNRSNSVNQAWGLLCTYVCNLVSCPAVSVMRSDVLHSLAGICTPPLSLSLCPIFFPLFFSQGASKLREHIEPEEKPTEVPVPVEKGVHYTRRATGGVVRVSNFLMTSLAKLTIKAGTGVKNIVQESEVGMVLVGVWFCNIVQESEVGMVLVGVWFCRGRSFVGGNERFWQKL